MIHRARGLFSRSQFPEFLRPIACAIAIGDLAAFGDILITSNLSAVGAAWPAANRALFFPFEITTPRIATVMGTYTPNVAVSGNLDVGIYDLAGNRLVSSGSVAQANQNTAQIINITDTLLSAGTYYMAMAKDSVAQQVAWPHQALLIRVFGAQQMDTAFPLPATATFANPASAYIPWLSVGFQPAGTM